MLNSHKFSRKETEVNLFKILKCIILLCTDTESSGSSYSASENSEDKGVVSEDKGVVSDPIAE